VRYDDKTRTTQLGNVQLRSGRALAFLEREYLEHETFSFEISEAPSKGGKNIAIRIPAHAVGVLRQALLAFEQRVFGNGDKKQ